jgi:hypothetical protein
MNKHLIILLLFLFFIYFNNSSKSNKNEFFKRKVLKNNLKKENFNEKVKKLDSVLCKRWESKPVKKDKIYYSKWCDYFSLLNKFRDEKFSDKYFKNDYIPYDKVGNTCVKDSDCGCKYESDKYHCDNGKCNVRNLYK